MSDGGDAARHTGVIGLAVMGENLALNIERNGFPIAVYNRTDTRTKEFMAERAAGQERPGRASRSRSSSRPSSGRAGSSSWSRPARRSMR